MQRQLIRPRPSTNRQYSIREIEPGVLQARLDQVFIWADSQIKEFQKNHKDFDQKRKVQVLIGKNKYLACYYRGIPIISESDYAI
jgi:hypothetical protein